MKVWRVYKGLHSQSASGNTQYGIYAVEYGIYASEEEAKQRAYEVACREAPDECTVELGCSCWFWHHREWHNYFWREYTVGKDIKEIFIGQT